MTTDPRSGLISLLLVEEGLRPVDFARKAGLTIQAVTNYTSQSAANYPSIGSLMKIAKAFDRTLVVDLPRRGQAFEISVTPEEYELLRRLRDLRGTAPETAAEVTRNLADQAEVWLKRMRIERSHQA